MSSCLNALVESVTTDEREDVVNQFFAHTINAWTVPGGVACDGDDDQDRLERFLTKFPRIEKAIAKNIARAATAQAEHFPAPPAVPAPATGPTDSAALQAPAQAVPQSQPLAARAPDLPRERAAADFGSHAEPATAAGPSPKRPMRLAAARTKYNEHYGNTLETQNSRTTDDKGRILDMFVDHLHLSHPELGDDPWVHTIDAAH